MRVRKVLETVICCRKKQYLEVMLRLMPVEEKRSSLPNVCVQVGKWRRAKTILKAGEILAKLSFAEKSIMELQVLNF